MNPIKFKGILRDIQKQYTPGFNISDFLKKRLNLDDKKAELLSSRISKLVDFNVIHTLNKTEEFRKDKEIPAKKEHKFNIYSLDSLSGLEFEEFLKWLFCELGYKVELTKSTADSGVDLVLTKDKIKIAVQAKRYNRNTKISNSVVLKTHGGMGVYKCDKSMIVTTSFFTRQAIADAKKLEIDLWDRDYLSFIIDKVDNLADNVAPKFEFPHYKTSLCSSLKNLGNSGNFSLKYKKNGKFDIYRHGINHPILSFRSNSSQVNHLSFRIKNHDSIPEYGSNSWTIISSDRGSIYGPEGNSAYSQVINYLKEFI